jgi:hypothetical protein
MSARSFENSGWPVRKWILVGAGVLAVQFGLLALLGSRGGAKTSPVTNSPPAAIAADSGRNLPLAENAAAFVLPNREGFSGRAWLESPRQDVEVKDWRDKPRPLEPQMEKLCGDLGALLKSPTSTNPGVPVFTGGERPDPPALEIHPGSGAELAIEGDLAGCKLLDPPPLEPRPASESADILDDTVVRVGVDEHGLVVSAIVFSKSGSAAADADALKMARMAQFQIPRSNDPAGPVNHSIIWGRMVFHWHAVDAADNKSDADQ